MRRIGNVPFIGLVMLVWLISGPIKAQDGDKELAETSRHCLRCHGNRYYSFENTTTDQLEKKRMNPYLMIDSMGFKHGEHGSFSCDDCHSPDYATYPHNGELKLEFKYSCLDCHGGDPAYAHLHFDEIETEAMKSVHAERMGDGFKCEMCHDPHTNRLVASSSKYTIPEIVAINNNMCLKCHGDENLFHIYTDKDQPEIIAAHDWLPNQSLHFKNVRCIECHTAKTDTMMVAHNILPKEQAIKNCVECHSNNSLLQAKLYKYQAIESREEQGLASSLKNKAYVIGSNRNRFLNIASVVIFGLVLGGILIHISARILKRD